MLSENTIHRCHWYDSRIFCMVDPVERLAHQTANCSFEVRLNSAKLLTAEYFKTLLWELISYLALTLVILEISIDFKFYS